MSYEEAVVGAGREEGLEAAWDQLAGYALAQFALGQDCVCAVTICVSYWTPEGATQVPAGL